MTTERLLFGDSRLNRCNARYESVTGVLNRLKGRIDSAAAPWLNAPEQLSGKRMAGRDARLTPLDDSFSYNLGEASRKIRNFLMIAMLASAGALLFFASYFFSRLPPIDQLEMLTGVH